MKFMLMYLADEVGDPCPVDQEPLKSWLEEMDARGVLLDGGPLRGPEAATTVRNQDGTVTIVDGPFAETKEQIAGFDLIEAKDLDEAIAIAAAHPAGDVEIRPVAPGMPTPRSPDQKAGAQRYLMFVCWDQTGADEILEQADDGEDSMAAWIEETGSRRLHGWQLQPPSLAHTVRNVDGTVTVTDGPFAENKEQIGGYDMLECADLDDAIGIATRHGAPVLDLRPIPAG